MKIGELSHLTPSVQHVASGDWICSRVGVTWCYNRFPTIASPPLFGDRQVDLG